MPIIDVHRTKSVIGNVECVRVQVSSGRSVQLFPKSTVIPSAKSHCRSQPAAFEKRIETAIEAVLVSGGKNHLRPRPQICLRAQAPTQKAMAIIGIEGLCASRYHHRAPANRDGIEIGDLQRSGQGNSAAAAAPDLLGRIEGVGQKEFLDIGTDRQFRTERNLILRRQADRPAEIGTTCIRECILPCISIEIVQSAGRR